MSSSQNVLWNDPQVVAGYRCIERITGPAGKLLIKQSGIISSKEQPLVILDNACGTGVISAALYEELDDTKKAQLQLTCGDITSGMIEYMQHVITSKKWTGASAQYIDAQKTGLPSDLYTHVFTNFGWQTIPKTLQAIDECFRVLRPNGVFASTTWEHLGWIEVIKEAIATIPNSPEFPERAAIMELMSDGGWDNQSWVKNTLEKHGFEDVQIDVQPMPMRWKNLQELMGTSFPKMMSMTPTKLWSKEDQDKYGPLLIPALEKFLLDKYGKDASFEFDMVAIIATAKKPGH